MSFGPVADDGRSVAWMSYVPLPGLALLAVALDSRSRLTRYHAWQGTFTVLGLLAYLLVMGLLARLSEVGGYRTTLGALAGIGLLAGLAQCGWGMVAASMVRFIRIRPWWNLAVLVRGSR